MVIQPQFLEVPTASGRTLLAVKEIEAIDEGTQETCNITLRSSPESPIVVHCPYDTVVETLLALNQPNGDHDGPTKPHLVK